MAFEDEVALGIERAADAGFLVLGVVLARAALAADAGAAALAAATAAFFAIARRSVFGVIVAVIVLCLVALGRDRGP